MMTASSTFTICAELCHLATLMSSPSVALGSDASSSGPTKGESFPTAHEELLEHLALYVLLLLLVKRITRPRGEVPQVASRARPRNTSRRPSHDRLGMVEFFSPKSALCDAEVFDGQPSTVGARTWGTCP